MSIMMTMAMIIAVFDHFTLCYTHWYSLSFFLFLFFLFFFFVCFVFVCGFLLLLFFLDTDVYTEHRAEFHKLLQAFSLNTMWLCNHWEKRAELSLISAFKWFVICLIGWQPILSVFSKRVALLILKVLFPESTQSFAPLLCFSLWAKSSCVPHVNTVSHVVTSKACEKKRRALGSTQCYMVVTSKAC